MWCAIWLVKLFGRRSEHSWNHHLVHENHWCDRRFVTYLSQISCIEQESYMSNEYMGIEYCRVMCTQIWVLTLKEEGCQFRWQPVKWTVKRSFFVAHMFSLLLMETLPTFTASPCDGWFEAYLCGFPASPTKKASPKKDRWFLIFKDSSRCWSNLDKDIIVQWYTLPETNISPENGWLKD